MSDIVDRLNEEIEALRADICELQDAAADEIERLRAELGTLKVDAIELAHDVMDQANIVWMYRDGYPQQKREYDRATETARRILEMEASDGS